MKTKYRLVCCAIVVIVLLRIGIGWHFLYEGVHKMDPAAGFSSEGFLGIAKGATAGLYFWMLPDLEGIQRLEMAVVTDKDGKERDTFIAYENAWKNYFKEYLVRYARIGAEEAASIVDMTAKEVAKWAVQNVPFQKAGTEGVAELTQAQLDEVRRSLFGMTVPAGVAIPFANRVPFAVGADAESIVNANVTRLAVWLEQNVPLPKADAETIAKEAQEKLTEILAKHVSSDEADATKIDDANVLQLAAWVDQAKIVVSGKRIFGQYLESLRTDASDGKNDIEAFKASRERFLETKRTIRNTTTFEQERRVQQLAGYRAEAARWTKKFAQMGDSLQSDMGRLVDPQLAGQRGEIITAPEKELIPPHPLLEQYGIQYTIPSNPYVKSRMQAMDLAVTFGLSAIGLCLILGFCTRLACLGGAAFLVNVVLVTYPVPGVFPPIPPMVGNFMFVSKDVVELLALLTLALMPAGRWGGLDYFLWHYGGKQIVGLFCPCACSTENKPA